MKNKILIFICLIFFISLSCVSASDINQTNIENVDNTILSTSNDVNVDNNIISASENIMKNDTLTLSNDDVLSDEGEFVDASEGYARLNAFRTENGVWQWNSDDTTKTVFNTDDSNQLKPLVRDTALEETAKIRAKELAIKYDHTRPDGSSCWTAFPDGYWATGENIAMGQRTWNQATEAWKETNDPYNGQGHRRNMLNPNFNSVGVAGYKLNGVTYWAQDFGGKYNAEELTKINPEDAFTVKNNTKNPEFNIQLPDDATGTFSVRVDGNVIDSEVLSNGKATITVTDLSEGSHEAIISYSGDNNYYTINKVTSVNVLDDSTPLVPTPTTDTGTFTDLNNLIQNTNTGETLKLTRNYKYNNKTDSSFKSGITINNDIIIDGQGHTINADKQARIFNINNVELKNITFINGYTTESGGAISSSSGSVSNCIFINNSAKSGGAIYLKDDFSTNVKIINSSFINNSAESGGAINIYSAWSYGYTSAVGRYDHLISNSFFDSNFANDGGAIFYTIWHPFCSPESKYPTIYDSLLTTNCNFINNYANDKGSVSYNEIHLRGDINMGTNIGYGFGIVYQNIIFDYCNFTNNICNNNTIWTNNTDINTDNISIFRDVSSKNCIFINNTDDKNGVNFNGDDNLKININKKVYGDITVQINNKNYSSPLKDNTTTIKVDNIESGKEYTVILTFVSDNDNTYIIYDKVTINTSVNITGTFTDLNNLIQNTNAGETLKLTRDYKYNIQTDSSFTDGITINNDIIIDGQGHTINADKQARIFNINNVELKNITFINGNVENWNSGGALSGSGSISNCTFINNTAKNGDGGAISNSGPISNCTFINNTASRNGGAISNSGPVSNCTFINNTGGYYGGGAIDSSGSVSNCTFINNTAHYGGAIDSSGSVSNCTFINNTAHFTDGGAISGSGSVSNCTFINNTASMNGGAINSVSGSVSNCTFINNTAKTNYKNGGGAINSVSGSVSNCTFINNIAGGDGSGGGAISGSGSISNCTFINNTAKNGDGGAISNSGPISNCTFINNTAGEFGGAISGSGSVSNCTFINNSAKWDGGAIYDSGFVSNCIFINNTGECAINVPNSASVMDCTFIKNSGNYGGAISCGISSVVNCTFINNTASQNGGAIYGVNAYIVNCTFINNTANSGGAIRGYNLGSVVNCTFINNTASQNGGAIILESHFSSNNLISNSLFKNNKDLNNCSIFIKNKDIIVFNNNTIDNLIYNTGTITSPTNIVVLDNKTISSYSNEVTLYATINDDNGNIIICDDFNFTINNKTIKGTLKYDSFKATTTLTDGEYVVSGEVNNLTDNTVKIGIIDVNTTKDVIIISAPDVTKYYGDSKQLNVTVTKNGSPFADAEIKINLEGNIYTKTTNNKGEAYLPIDLDSGIYDATITYTNTSIFVPAKVVKITVKPVNTDINLSYVQDSRNSVTLTAIVNSTNATGDIVFNVNGKEYASKISNSKATYTLNNLEIGTYTVNASYAGDINHINSTSDSVSFTVEENKITMSAPDVTKYYGGSERFIVSLKDKDNKGIAGENVTITINGQKYIRTTNSDGEASMAINLNSGEYVAVSQYDGYNATSKVTVLSTISAKDVTKIFRNGTQYYATFLDAKGNLLKNTPVTFNINGVFYTRNTDENGVARLNINLDSGAYIITATNPVTNEQKANLVKVLPSIVENHDIIKYYKNDTQYWVKILNDDGTAVGAGVSVTFNINGVFYTRTTNESGYVRLNINLNPNTYIITVMYNGLSVSNTIKVLPVLSANNLNMHYRDGSKFEAKLVDGQGNVLANQLITFNINGVFYDRMTNDNGIAMLNINLMAGKYIITSMYSNGASISNTVTISS